MNQSLLGVVGIAAIILIAILFSSNRRAIRLRVVGAAFALQAVIAFLVALRVLQDTLVYPRLIRKGMHLSTPALVLSLWTGAVLGGAGGVILALPVAGFLSVSLRHWRDYRLIEQLVKANAQQVVAQQPNRPEHEGHQQTGREQ